MDAPEVDVAVLRRKGFDPGPNSSDAALHLEKRET
jgi:hypothetical protein